MLIQIHSLSYPKALEIISLYPTFSSLLYEYMPKEKIRRNIWNGDVGAVRNQECGRELRGNQSDKGDEESSQDETKRKERLLADLRYGKTERRIGEELSKRIYRFFVSKDSAEVLFDTSLGQEENLGGEGKLEKK